MSATPGKLRLETAPPLPVANTHENHCEMHHLNRYHMTAIQGRPNFVINENKVRKLTECRAYPSVIVNRGMIITIPPSCQDEGGRCGE